MADLLPVAFVRQFEDDIRLQVQQEESRLEAFVRSIAITGTLVYVNRLDTVEVEQKTQRFQPTIISNAPHSRRQIPITDFTKTLGLDDQDLIRLAQDPKAEYVVTLGRAVGRQLDRTIITALGGDSLAVDASLVSSVVPFDPANIVPVNATNLTVDKLRLSKLILDRNEVPKDGRQIVINASALSSLLAETETTSSDFNTVKALVQGEIDTFMGYKFIMTELLVGTDTVAAEILVFHKMAAGIAMGNRMKVRITERDDLQYAQQVHIAATFGAIRIEEPMVAKIICDQT